MTAPRRGQGWRRFALDHLQPEPWRNGAGQTRPVASRQDGAGIVWRVSVAEIEAAGPFSRFEDIDRTAVMVEGTQLRLVAPQRQLTFDGPGSQVHFPGEQAWHCEAPTSPTRLWNVMVRRGAACAVVRSVEDQVVLVPEGQGAAQVADWLVLVVRGAFELAGPDGQSGRLVARDGLHLRTPAAFLRLTPCQPGSLLVITGLNTSSDDPVA